MSVLMLSHSNSKVIWNSRWRTHTHQNQSDLESRRFSRLHAQEGNLPGLPIGAAIRIREGSRLCLLQDEGAGYLPAGAGLSSPAGRSVQQAVHRVPALHGVAARGDPVHQQGLPDILHQEEGADGARVEQDEDCEVWRAV